MLVSAKRQVAALLLVLVAISVGGCAHNAQSPVTTAQPAPEAADVQAPPDPKAILREAAAEYLLTLPPGENKLKAQDLKPNLDQNPDLYLVIDTRKVEDYAKGHIPGAVQMSAPRVGQAIRSGELPSDRQIVVICYTGQGAMQVTTALRFAGYNAVDLLSGYPAWETAGYPQVSN